MLIIGTAGRLTEPLGNGTHPNARLRGVEARVAGTVRETEDGTVYLFETAIGTYRGFEWEFAPDAPVGVEEKGRARAAGYDETPCPKCGAFTMKRAGSCLCCDQCGETTGCG